MLKIGLTGNIGSGKSIAARIFEILGVPVYHADEKAKHILDKKEVTEKIRKLFGEEVIDSNGKPDRKKLAGIVFSDTKKLTELNKIIHPAVISDYKEWLKKISSSYSIMESAILFETGYSGIFDRVIVVTAPEKIRIERVMKRDNASTEEVKQRIKNQMKEKSIKEKADLVIINDNKKLIIPQVLRIHKKIISK